MDDFLKLSNINIIDIRDKNCYIMGHIYNSINIPMNILLFNCNRYLDKKNTYYLYCDSGYRSRNLSNKLNNLGYNTISIDGGYNLYRLKK